MANLPEGVSSLGPVYLPTDTKEKYRDACKEKKTTMEAQIKGNVHAFIKSVFPDWNPPESV